jgi:hypothetical protein
MEKAVYLVGTRHSYMGQGRHPMFRQVTRAELDKFKAYLKCLVTDLDIQAIPEEMNVEGLRMHPRRDLPPDESIAFQMAREMNIPHCYCDPDTPRRQALGISVGGKDTTEDIEKREADWMRCVDELNSFPCLFVCGADHVDSFGRVLETSKCRVVVLARDWPVDVL